MIRVTPEQFLDMWRHDDVRVLCERPHDLEETPDLALRIRGAFGAMLAEQLPPVSHRFDPFRRPAAWPALFGGEEHADAARPFVIDVDVGGATVTVCLRLFGWAAMWIDPCARALVDALAGGVSLRGGHLRTPFRPIEATTGRGTASSNRANVGAATIRLATPFCVRRGEAVRLGGAEIVTAMVTRMRALAPWQGVEIDADWKGLHRAARDVIYDETNVRLVRFERYSRRQPGQPIPMRGGVGALRITGRQTPFHPFFETCAWAHAGSHAALGFGRVIYADYMR